MYRTIVSFFVQVYANVLNLIIINVLIVYLMVTTQTKLITLCPDMAC